MAPSSTVFSVYVFMYVYILCGDVLPIVGFTPMAHCLPVPVWWEIASSLPSITFLTSFLILWTPTVSPQYYEMHNPNLSLHGCHSLSCCILVLCCFQLCSLLIRQDIRTVCMGCGVLWWPHLFFCFGLYSFLSYLPCFSNLCQTPGISLW